MSTDDTRVKDNVIQLFWDEKSVSRQRVKPEPAPRMPEPRPGALVIGTSPERILVVVHADGKLEYGPEYTPDEAAVTFWEEMGRRKLEMDERLLLIGHMDAVLTQLGAADIQNQKALEKLSEKVSTESVLGARRAEVALTNAMHNAIELGRGMVYRPDLPMSETAPQEL
jgi:hypothetical protein